MSHWFERHPHLLARERAQLASNGNYVEHRQARAVFFASTGEVVVRVSGRSQRHPILISYPTATPYALPQVYLLREVLSAEDLTQLVSGTVPRGGVLRGKTVFHHRRHQQPDGSLCLLEPDNLEQQGALTVDANGVLARVRDWLAGLTTGHFPYESAEVNLFEHYPNRLYQQQVLLPEPLLQAAGLQGSFFLYRLGRPTGDGIVRYLAAGLLSQTASGLLMPETQTPLGFSPESMGLAAALLDPTVEGPKRRSNGELLEVTWWKLASEPPVFADADALLEALGAGDITAGETRALALWPQLQDLPKAVYLGLCFPNRRGELEWVILLTYRVRENIVPGREPTVRHLLGAYDFAAVYTEPFTDHSYHQRNAARASRADLRDRNVALLGCGALGSEVADAMGKAGVGTLRLCDFEYLHAHNSVRHAAGIRYAGYKKVRALRHLILDHNPFVQVSVSDANLLGRDLAQDLPADGVGISTIADDNVEAYINEQALALDRTVFYARALRGGKAARIFRVIPGRDACFHCLTLYRAEESPLFLAVPDDETLPTVRNECNNPIRPASAADLKLVAALASRYVLDFLLNPTPTDTNNWVLSTETLPGLAVQSGLPLAVDGRTLPPHPYCPYCQRQGPAEIKLAATALAFMRGLTVARAGIETGGILVGRLDPLGHIDVVEASGPGPNAVHLPGRFERDVAYCQAFLEEAESRGMHYVGEWHSHPDADNRPSYTDLDSLSQIALQSDYLTTQPVMMIFSSTGEPSCTVHPAEHLYYTVTPVVVA
jgi:integrative and conjugative element protein (TIGR02256 family)